MTFLRLHNSSGFHLQVPVVADPLELTEVRHILNLCTSDTKEGYQFFGGCWPEVTLREFLEYFLSSPPWAFL